MEQTEDAVYQAQGSDVRIFKDKIEGALQLFANMKPSKRAESIILWNIVSDKLQGIINQSVDALNEVSIIVVRNNNPCNVIAANLAESLIADNVDMNINPDVSRTDELSAASATEIITQSLTCSGSESAVLNFSRSKEGNTQPNKWIGLTECQKLPTDEFSEIQKVDVAATTSDLIKLNPSNASSDSSSYSSSSSDDDESCTPNCEADNLNLDCNASTGSCTKSGLSLETSEFGKGLKYSKILLSTLSKKRKKRKFISDVSLNFNAKIDLVVERNRWSCNSCEKQFDDYLVLQNHIRSDHTVSKFKPIKCNLCDATLSTKSNYNVHLRKHTGERPFSCAKCSVTFTTSNNLRRHMLTHQGVKPYRCSICDSRFAEKRSLQIHHRTHTGDRPYRCTECDSSFRQKSVLKSHMTTHSQDKPFICSECGQAFKKKSLLRSHESRHNGEKKYDCHYCKSAFVTKGDLNRHERSHRGEKRFTCQEENCGISFMRNQSLQEHMNRHQGIKPYKCDKCPKSYPQLSEFRKHYKKHKE